MCAQPTALSSGCQADLSSCDSKPAALSQTLAWSFPLPLDTGESRRQRRLESCVGTLRHGAAPDTANQPLHRSNCRCHYDSVSTDRFRRGTSWWAPGSHRRSDEAPK